MAIKQGNNYSSFI